MENAHLAPDEEECKKLLILMIKNADTIATELHLSKSLQVDSIERI